jgi:hypothetical protein
MARKDSKKPKRPRFAWFDRYLDKLNAEPDANRQDEQAKAEREADDIRSAEDYRRWKRRNR